MARIGRPPEPGTVYYLGRLRFRPGVDPPQLQAFLERFQAAEPGYKSQLLRAALIGGLEAPGAADNLVGGEDDETAALLDDLLGDF